MIAAWMVYAVAVSVPVALGAMAMAALLRRYGIPQRGVWLTGLALAAALPLFRLLPRGAAPVPEGAVAFVDLGLPAEVTLSNTGPLQRMDDLAVLAWLALSALLAWVLLRSVQRLWASRRGWTPGMRSGEEVLLSHDVGPAVFGVVRPEIVLPRWTSQVPEDQLRLIVRHEAQHISAGDPWLVALTLALRVLLPWHPGVWLLTAGLREAIELDCDRRVLRERSDVRSYGETVLAVASRMRPGSAQPVAAFTEPVRFIKRRLLAMTQPQKRLGHYGALGLAAITVLILVGACETPIPALEDEEPTQAAVVDEEAEGVTLEAREVEVPEFTPFTTAPRLLNRDEAIQALEEEYPPLLRDAGVGGTVKVMVFIDEGGTLTDVRVDESSGHQALDQAAIRVAQRFVFTAALKEDEPVGAWISLPIRFQVR